MNSHPARIVELNRFVELVLTNKTITREAAFDKLCELEGSLNWHGRRELSMVLMTRLCGIDIPQRLA
jgi:hypothetical protein